MSSSTMAAPAAPTTTHRLRPRSIGLWVIQIVLATQFAGAGLMKLSGDAVMVDMFAEIGAGQWFRHLVGALELAGAIGLLVPRWCGPAALGLAGVMTGATLTNVLVLAESPVLPLVYLAVAGLVAWLRRPTIVRLLRRPPTASRG